MDPQVDYIEQLLKESTMFNNYFNDYVGFASISKGKLPSIFTILDMKFS